MRKTLIIFTLLFHYILVYSQMDISMGTKQPQIPSWESYEFIKYGKIGTSLYTGTVNYSIPIFTYKDKDFEIPISIDYATNGFRVNHKSGILGHGWMLDVPGVIIREIKGIPDELTEPTITPFNGGGILRGYKNCQKTDSLFGSIHGPHGGIFPGKFNNYSFTNGSETTPDLYSFNFCGYIGTFECNSNGGFTFFNLSNQSLGLSIEDFDETSNIRIVDNQGYEYVFEKDETYQKKKDDDKSEYQEKYDVILRWHLKSITAPNNRKIHFNYSNINQSDFEYNYYPQLNYYHSYSPSQTEDNSNFTQTIQIQKTYVSQLKNIIFPDNSKMYFEYENGGIEYRSYNSKTKPISGINKRLKNIRLTQNDKIIKSCQFEYQYQHPQTNNAGSITFLKNVTISGEGCYTFCYNDMYGYPFLGTTEYDHWGYYNGKGNGFPMSGFINYLEYDFLYNETISTDCKYPLFEAALSGTLNKITYPTGGFSCLEYEPHTYSKHVTRYSENLFTPELHTSETDIETGGIRIKSIKTFSSDNTLEETIDYEYKINGTNGSSSGILINCPRYGIKYLTQSNNSTPKSVTYYNLTNHIFDYNSTHIEYSRVSAKRSGRGRTDYEYSTYNEYTDLLISQEVDITIPFGVVDIFQSNNFLENIFTPLASYQTKRGKLIKESYYDNNGNLIKSITNNYSHPTVCEDTTLCIVGEIVKNVFFPRFNSWLKSTTTHDYSNDSFISKTTDYTYNNYGLPKTVTETTSNGNKLKTINYYVTDTITTTGIFLNMKNNHIMSDIIKQEKYRINGNDSTLLSSFKYDYYNPNETNTKLIRPRKAMEFIPGYGWKQKNTFQYDTIGNLIEETNPKGISKTYLWGYSNRHLISLLDNATFAETKTALEQANISYYDLTNFTDLSDLDFNSLQTLSSLLPLAMVNVYRYKPFAGVTEIVQPNSLKTFCSYDGYGRISDISNNSHHLIEQYNYNSVSIHDLKTDFSCNPYYYKNDIPEFTLNVTGGSGTYSHKWVIKNSNDSIVYEHKRDTTVFLADFENINLKSREQYTIECTTVDLISEETSVYSHDFFLKPKPLYFFDITENINLNLGTGSKTAYLSSDGTDTVTFALDVYTGGGLCTIKIGNNTFSYSGKNEANEITVQLNSGYNPVSIELENSFAETMVSIALISSESHEIDLPDILSIEF